MNELWILPIAFAWAFGMSAIWYYAPWKKEVYANIYLLSMSGATIFGSMWLGSLDIWK